jgi:AraC-like DNA-binding protein
MASKIKSSVAAEAVSRRGRRHVPREPTISAGFAAGLLEFAVSRGADRAELLSRSEIDARDLGEQDNRVPLVKYKALMHAAKELTHDPAFALHFGEAVDMADVSIIGLIARASETFVEAMTQINRFHRLGVDVEGTGGGSFTVVKRVGTHVWLVDARKIPRDFPELTEAYFARSIAGIRRIVDVPVAKALRFTHKEPPYRAEYDRIFRAPVEFESDMNATLIDEVWLTFKNPLASRYAFGALNERAEALQRQFESADTTRARVESLIMPILHTGDANMQTIAAKMGIGVKTLFRKLKAEGLTFEKVLDELRRRLALDYLAGKKVSVSETAYLVGFSDAATFSRAFKRWTGAPPVALRK